MTEKLALAARRELLVARSRLHRLELRYHARALRDSKLVRRAAAILGLLRALGSLMR